MIAAALALMGCLIVMCLLVAIGLWLWLRFGRVDVAEHERQHRELARARHENTALKRSLRVVTHQRDETMEALRRLRDETRETV